MEVTKGVSIAMAVSALLAMVGCGSDDKENTGESASRIMCEGGNSCAGHSACASADGSSSCEGMNSCKGTGWVYADSEEECAELKAANKPS
jgi:predicted amidohydrolase